MTRVLVSRRQMPSVMVVNISGLWSPGGLCSQYDKMMAAESKVGI
jgi:hypothetical protein